MKNPHVSHWKIEKIYSLYSSYSLVVDMLQFMGTPLLVSFTNSNWVNDLNDKKYSTGYVFILGSGLVT